MPRSSERPRPSVSCWLLLSRDDRRRGGLRPGRTSGVGKREEGLDMANRILLTTTSYQDTPGKHHDVLKASGFDVVRARGPISEQQMLDLVNDGEGFDGLLNGDDLITAKVIDAAMAAKRPL